MSASLDLTGDIATAIDGASLRGRTLAVGYVDDDGYPVIAFRGSTLVLGPTQLAIWLRKRVGGMAQAIADRPTVTLAYLSPEGPGPAYLAIRGQARIDESVADAVWSAMIETERDHDPDRAGVPVVIDVERVRGYGADGFFERVAATAA